MMTPPPARRAVSWGVQRIPAGQHLPRHAHAASYVTLVLEGRYEQVGYGGRWRAQAGDVLVQPTLDCHSDTMSSRGLVLMRLPWRHEAGLGGVWRGLDVDEIRRAGTADPAAGRALVAALVTARPPLAPVEEHWVDPLVARLAADPRLSIADWAQGAGRSREATARAFGVRFGVAPARLRLELRTRAAWLRIVGTREALSVIAQELGFADQAHMTRAVRWLTQATPGWWRSGRADAGAGPTA
jgi:AraC-like DNA-binding protein